MKALMIGDQRKKSVKQQRLMSCLPDIMRTGGITVTMQADSQMLYPDGWDLVLIVGTPDEEAAALLSALAPAVPVLLFVADPDFHVSLPGGTRIHFVFYVDSLPKGYADYPKEMTAVIRVPGFRPAADVPFSLKNPNALRIAFINCQDNLYASKQMLAVFNDLKGHDCLLFEHDCHLGLLQEHADHHVQLRLLKDYPSCLPAMDLVITNGQAAVDAVLHQKPVIVAGINGFAGLVNEKNLSAHIKYHFSGRIGGYIGERIPVTMVVAELLAAHASMQGFLPLQQLADTTADVYGERKTTEVVITRTREVIETIRSVYEDTGTLLQMAPQIVGNIAFDNREGQMVLKRLGCMKTLNEFTDDEKLMLTLFDGSKSLWELLQAAGLEDTPEEVLPFVRYCFENKIIFFTNGIGHDRLPRETAVDEQL